ncbi:MAG: signal peptide peptidase SppA [Deltaproteobacteria bacterium]
MTILNSIFKSFGGYDFVEIELRGEIPEEEKKGLLPFLGGDKTLTVGNVEIILATVEGLDSIRGVVITIGDLGIGPGRANSLRRRLRGLRKKGKSVFIYLESGGNIEYLIASAGDYIFVPPWAMLNLTGLNAEVTFFKDTLDKIGIEAELKGFGEYKSAAETFTRSSMSDPHREMIDSIMGDLEAQLEDYISEGRGIEKNEVKRIIDRGPFVSQSALDAGLIDGVIYPSEIEEKLFEVAGCKVRTINAYRFLRVLNLKNKLKSFLGVLTGRGALIAVVADSGIVTLGESRGGGGMKTMGSISVIKLLDEASKNRNVKAIVLRILTPGGSGVASDLVRKKVESISEKTPVVVSMSDVAASGGYMIALGAATIVADPMSLTGSIGVVSGKFNLKGLYDRLGVKKEGMSYGRHSGMFSLSKGFSEEEEKKLEDIMKFYYDGFVKTVSDGRGMDMEEALKASKGRVWTGRQAKELGLADELGGTWDAVNIASGKAGLTYGDVSGVKFYSEDRGFQLSSLFKTSSNLEVLERSLLSLISQGRERILAMMPYKIDIR